MNYVDFGSFTGWIVHWSCLHWQYFKIRTLSAIGGSLAKKHREQNF